MSERGLTVVNPFGMAIQDVALAGRIADAARTAGLGSALPHRSTAAVPTGEIR